MKSIVFFRELLGNRVSLEKAREFEPPESLEFNVNPDVELENNKLILEGKITNPTKKSITTIIFPVGSENPFSMGFLPSNNVSYNQPLPPPPQTPPSPVELIIPQESEILFHANINLDNYNYDGSPTVEIEWVFNYWNEPKPKGSVSVILPSKD